MADTFNEDTYMIDYRPRGQELAKSIEEKLGEPNHRVFIRSGDRDLEATVWCVGSGTVEAGSRRTVVEICVTREGAIIASRQSEEDEGDRWTITEAVAPVRATPEEVLSFLMSDGGGWRLGPASKDAWEQACTTVPGWEDLLRERIA